MHNPPCRPAGPRPPSPSARRLEATPSPRPQTLLGEEEARCAAERVAAERALRLTQEETAQRDATILPEANLPDEQDDVALARLAERLEASKALRQKVNQRKAEFRILMEDAEEVHSLLSSMDGQDDLMAKEMVTIIIGIAIMEEQ